MVLVFVLVFVGGEAATICPFRCQLSIDVAGFLQGGFEVESLTHQFTGGTGTEFHAFNVLCYGEVLLAVGCRLVLDTE